MTGPNDPSAPMPDPDTGSPAPRPDVEPPVPPLSAEPVIDQAEAAASAAPLTPAEPVIAPVETALPPPTEPGVAVPWAAPPPPTDASTTVAWAAPTESRGRGWVKGCAIAAVLGVVLLIVAYFALVFLGGQVLSILKGTVLTGTGGTECTVTGQATTFPASSSVHLVAYFQRTVEVGEVITTVSTGPDGTNRADEDPATTSASCLYFDIEPGLTPGHYAIEFRSGTELLSKGTFDITP